MSVDFPLDPMGYHYRGLRRTEPAQQGWDVYALQTLLAVQADGILGDQTAEAIWTVQRLGGMYQDGVAGQITQIELVKGRTKRHQQTFALKERLLYSQIMWESSGLVGNQSLMREDGTADCGVTQRNSAHTPPLDGFNAEASIFVLARQLSVKHEEYKRLRVKGREAWELAAGSWNAPAWTDKLARGETLPAYQLDHITHYINEATALVKW